MRLFLIGVLIGVLVAPLPTIAEENPRLVQRTVVYWALQSSVVLIQMVPSTPPRENAFCGGVVIDPSTILTAAHCIRNNRKYTVRSYLGDTAVPLSARVCVECDLALVTLQKVLLNVRPVALSMDVAVGDTVYLVGAPSGERFLVTRGIISKVANRKGDNTCYEGDLTGTREQQAVLFDAAVFYGNSGGGAWSDRGELIGIVVRLETANELSCTYVGEMVLWGWAVGPLAVQAFLENQ